MIRKKTKGSVGIRPSMVSAGNNVPIGVDDFGTVTLALTMIRELDLSVIKMGNRARVV